MKSGNRFFKGLLLVYALSVGHFIYLPVANAGMIGTEALVAQENEEAAGVDAAKTRQLLTDQLIALGVETGDAQARVGALSEQELAYASDRLNELPAGGNVFIVLGVIFLVLLVLELVGVTHIFSAI
jgi:hypothetical protein